MKDKLYVIALKNDVSTEDDLFIVKAKDREEALYNYAKNYYIKDEYFTDSIEDRAINGDYWLIFFKNIYNFNIEEGYTTDLTEDEISTKLKENIKNYLARYNQYTDMLFDFYNDENKKLKDLDSDLIMIMALKSIYRDIKFYIIKEIKQ